MVSVPVQLEFCKGETSNHCGVFGGWLFGLGSMLLLVFLPIVVDSFQLRPELLQCSLGFIEFVDPLVDFFRAEPVSSKFLTHVLMAWQDGTQA
jgi:hypothetical protein